MTIDYRIDENDFLTHQLYLASKSERIKKKRKRNRLIVPIIYFVFSLLSFFQGGLSLAVIFFIIAPLWFFIYPLWERRYYKKHYQGFIQENYKDRLGKTASLELSKDFILVKDRGSESKVLTTEISEINEIPTTIFVRLKGGQSFILPKDKITNIDYVTIRLKELAIYLKVEYNIDEKWEWK